MSKQKTIRDFANHEAINAVAQAKHSAKLGHRVYNKTLSFALDEDALISGNVYGRMRGTIEFLYNLDKMGYKVIKKDEE